VTVTNILIRHCFSTFVFNPVIPIRNKKISSEILLFFIESPDVEENGRNGHRPASAGIYCSLWESKLQEIMVRLDHLIYWTAIYSSN
jgi:type III secretory pathway component EscV